MSENWAIALSMFVLGQAGIFGLAGIAAFWNLKREASADRLEMEHRLTELETKCEKWFVVAGSHGLHRDDDKYGVDKELERFVMLYRAGNHDMPANEWVHYRGVFRSIADNILATTNERALADALAELCDHKMARDRTT